MKSQTGLVSEYVHLKQWAEHSFAEWTVLMSLSKNEYVPIEPNMAAVLHSPNGFNTEISNLAFSEFIWNIIRELSYAETYCRIQKSLSCHRFHRFKVDTDWGVLLSAFVLSWLPMTRTFCSCSVEE